MLSHIDLQRKTQALPGTVSAYWFENESIGLKNTLFHRIEIPLKPFDSGLDWEDQPVSTEIVFEWYELGLDDPKALDGLNLSSASYPKAEASVYVGTAHNWCDIGKLLLFKNGDNDFRVDGQIFVQFELEGVALNETFLFSTTLKYLPEMPQW